MNGFEQMLSDRYDIDIDDVRGFVCHLRLVEVGKNVNVVEKGSFNDNFYIIRKGVLRAFLPVDGGEQTLWFAYPGEAIFDVWCYNNGGLSPISIETVVSCELYCISKETLETLCCESLTVCNIVRKMFIGYATESEEGFTNLFSSLQPRGI